MSGPAFSDFGLRTSDLAACASAGPVRGGLRVPLLPTNNSQPHSSVTRADVGQQRFRLELLKCAEQVSLLDGAAAPGGFFARIHEGKRIPHAAWQKSAFQREAVVVGQTLVRAAGQLRESWMLAHAAPPVLRVPVIRLPPVHDCMNESRVGARQVLDDPMRLVEMVVPEEHQRPE